MSNITQDLAKLISENPGLEIIPLVTEECADPNYTYTMSCISKVDVDEYVISPFNDERLFFKSGGWDDDFIQVYFDNDPYERDEIPYEEVKAAFEALEWTKAILLYIDAY